MKSGKQRRTEIRERRATNQAKRVQVRLADPRMMEGVPASAMAPCNPQRLRESCGYPPEFAQRGFYIDTAFDCVDCGKQEIWRATQQKWWYEVARGAVESCAIRCRACRQRDRARAAEARRVHLQGLAAKARRTAGS